MGAGGGQRKNNVPYSVQEKMLAMISLEFLGDFPNSDQKVIKEGLVWGEKKDLMSTESCS